MHTDSGITDVSGDEMGAGAPVTVVVSDYGSLLALLFQVTPALLTKLITDPEFHFAVLMSLATSLTSLVLAFLIAVPAAW